MAVFAKTMPRMLKELDAKPEAGLLWYRTHASWRMLMVQQYWESFEKLLAYAQDRNGEQFPAWGRFMKQLMQDAIGIWHETYLVEPAEGHLAAARDRFAG